MSEAEPSEASVSRLRILLAALVLVGILVVLVVVSRSGGEDSPEREVAELDEECLELWNDSGTALSFGAHNASISHGYIEAEVTHLDENLQESEDGLCAVVFASPRLDPEPIAAGMLRRNSQWTALANLAGRDFTLLAQLQSSAAAAPNVSLDRTGKLTPLVP